MTWEKRLLYIVALLTRGILGVFTIIQMGRFSPKVALVFIGRNGSMQVEKFPKVTSSTMLMVTMTTTNYQILNVCLTASTRGFTWLKDFAANLVNNWINGDAANLDSELCGQMPRKCTLARRDVHQRALIVEILLKRDILVNAIVQNRVLKLLDTNNFLKSVWYAIRSFGRRCTKQKKCKPVHIIAVGNYDVAKPVYNLTVADAHLFYANGFLSSNTDAEDHCPDEIRYMCNARPYSRPEDGPDKGRIMTVGPSNELQIKDVMGEFEKPKENKFFPYKRL